MTNQEARWSPENYSTPPSLHCTHQEISTGAEFFLFRGRTRRVAFIIIRVKEKK